LNLPAGFPAPKTAADNSMTAAKVELGRHLFYDTRLSINGKQSCASCHDQAKAFTDARARAVGTTGEIHPRSSMSIVNIAYTPVLTWANPNMKRLERQALVPMFGEHPVELGLSGKEKEVLVKLKAEPRYQKLFPESFPGEARPFTIENVTKAIAAFERTLISGASPYDRYLNGDRRAISLSAKRGEALFFSERLECFHCHGGFNFSQSEDHEGKAFTEIEFHNTGLYNLDGKGAFPKDNMGVFEFTGRPEDMGKFRAPTLRNIAVTAPYMHDGSIATLEGVIDHYAAGGRTISAGEYKGVGSASPQKSAFVKGFRLTAREKRDLITFLRSLTDEKFLRDPRFSNPWSQQQTVGAEERHPFRGQIKWIDADRLGVTVRHEAGPGLMGAMTMRFLVKNPNELAPFKPGDLIEAELVTDETSGEAWLEGFRPRPKRKR
jgi:cytochrome c peroxidase